MATPMLSRLPTPLEFELDLLLDPSFNLNFDSLPPVDDVFGMPPAGMVSDVRSWDEPIDLLSYEDAHMESAVQSANQQGQTAATTGRTVAASDLSPSQAGRMLPSHFGGALSTVRVPIDGSSGGSRSPGTRSPGTTSLILTPTSTLLDYNASISDHTLFEGDDTDENRSPISDQYVHVSHSDAQPGADVSRLQISQMSGYPAQPSSSQGSGVSDGQQLSQASSIAPPAAMPSGGQWGGLMAAGGVFSGQQQQQQSSYNYAGYYRPDAYNQGPSGFTSDVQQYASDAYVADMAIDSHAYSTAIPYRSGHDHHVIEPQSIHGGRSMLTASYQPALVPGYGQADFTHHQHPQHQVRHDAQYGHPQVRDMYMATVSSQSTIPTTSAYSRPAQAQTPLTALKLEQPSFSPSPVQPALNLPRHTIPSQQRQQGGHVVQPAISAEIANMNSSQELRPSGKKRQPSSSTIATKRPLQAAKARQIVPTNASRQIERSRKGGRQRGDHLDDEAKAKSSKMRKAVACWRCALQRDPCDPGTPCNRCLVRAQKGQPCFFACDRSKLPDLVHDFLPATMTLMHQKQTIEDTVNDQVLRWDMDNPITIYLTSGYGPPLMWEVHEFKPRTNDLLGQFQYLQDPGTGKQQRYHKYSPPFGLLKLDSSDDDHLNQYLDTLLTEDYLWDLGWTCFEEESQVDEECFQAKLVDCMCTLYLETKDPSLKEILREILRMLIITYIMGHTLTITDDILPTVLGAVKFSAKGPVQPFTSPRLANRQLKFYFAKFRSNIYEKILKWQQQTFHTSGKKENTWLESFCAMLGFAMVLEEVQRTIIIQADAKAVKNEMSFDHANTEASNACSRIDERWRLLVGLFQCKYRDKKWGDGSFGQSTPRYNDPAEHEFLGNVRELLERQSDHLRNRRDVQFSIDNQCLYTSRLVARFLLPFLDLPHT